MSSLDTEFNRRLAKKINDADENTLDHMRSGNLDFEQYKDRTGYLRALEHVREWCQEIESDITEGK